MRRPLTSLGCVAFHARFRDAVRPLLLDHLRGWPEAVERVSLLTGGASPPHPAGPPAGLAGEALDELRVKVAAAVGQPPPGAGPGLKPAFLRAFAALAGDPDRDLAGWVEGGAPLGIRTHIAPSGIFPALAGEAPASEADIGGISADPTGWENYRSAEDDLPTCAALLDHMVQSGWAVRCRTHEHLLRELGVSSAPLNRLGLISKTRPDGTVKHRLIWDLRRSEVNSLVRQGERIVLPRLLDAVSDALDLSLVHGTAEVRFLGTDITDAFHLIPIAPEEYPFTCCAAGEHFYYFRVLVFGAASAPTVWGRFGAWLGRSTAAVTDPRFFRGEMYVDDPLYTLGGGGAPDRAREGALALLWAAVVGYPLSWPKTSGGTQVQWIGATLTIRPSEIQVSVPAGKIAEARSSAEALSRRGVASRRGLRALAGRLSYFAGLVPRLRPFVRPLWAAATSPPAGSSLPAGLVHTKRYVHSMAWIRAFLCGTRGPLSRSFGLHDDRRPLAWSITTDASPWGFGAVLSRLPSLHPVAYYHDAPGPADIQRFDAQTGDPAFNTLWEALAILVALRVWQPHFGPGPPLQMRSDNLGVLQALSARSAPAASLQTSRQALSSDEELHNFGIRALVHIPGASNVVADALSRLGAPDPKPFPAELYGVRRTPVPTRNAGF